MRIRWHSEKLLLREPFRISRSVMHERGAVCVELSDGEHVGRGEAVTSVYYDLDEARIIEQLAGLQPAVQRCDDPADFLGELPRTATGKVQKFRLVEQWESGAAKPLDTN